MNTYMTEDEQIEMIKKWWNDYGNTLLTAILIVVVAISGWRFYQYRQLKTASQASYAYEAMINSVANNNETDANAQAQNLIDNFSNTPYAKMASLVLARQAVEKNKYTDAVTRLSWVIQNAKTPSLKQIARLRAARVLLAQKKAQQALNLLKNVDDKAYAPLIAELRGDVYTALGNKAKAREEYAVALQALPGNAVTRPIIQMKLNEIAKPEHLNKSSFATNAAGVIA